MKEISERHQLILKKLTENGKVSIPQLSDEMKVSGITVRKDLKLPEEKKLFFRTRGGGSITDVDIFHLGGPGAWSNHYRYCGSRPEPKDDQIGTRGQGNNRIRIKIVSLTTQQPNLMRSYLFLSLFVLSCQLCPAQPSSKQTKAIWPGLR